MRVSTMKTIEEIRHARLLELIEQFPTLQALADSLGRKAAQVSQWKNRYKRSTGGVHNIDSDSARNIELKLGKPRGWMDCEHEPRTRRARAAPEPMSSMGATVASWLDALPEDKRHKAFWLIHQMVFADEWPAAPAARPAASAAAPNGSAAPAPSPAPSEAPLPSARR